MAVIGGSFSVGLIGGCTLVRNRQGFANRGSLGIEPGKFAVIGERSASEGAFYALTYKHIL